MKNLTEEEFEDIVWNDEEYKEITEAKVFDQRRWQTRWYQIFQKLSDETLWRVSWDRGSTEQQDGGPENITLEEVEAYPVTVTKYRKKK